MINLTHLNLNLTFKSRLATDYVDEHGFNAKSVFIRANPWLKFEVEIDVAGETDGFVIHE